MQLLPNNFTGGIHHKKNYLHPRNKQINQMITKQVSYTMGKLCFLQKNIRFSMFPLLSIYDSLSSAYFLSHREGNDLITRPLGLIQSYNKSCGSFVKWLHGWLQPKIIQSFDSNTDIFPEYVNCNINNPKILEIFVALFVFIHFLLFINPSSTEICIFGRTLPDPTHFSS